MSDAVVFEPIPYRSALRENCTHVIAVRTRAGTFSAVRHHVLLKFTTLSATTLFQTCCFHRTFSALLKGV